MVMPERPEPATHLAIYHLEENGEHKFQVRLGHADRFKPRYPASMRPGADELTRVHVEPLPPELANVLNAWIDAHPPFPDREDAHDRHHRILGSLGFVVKNGHAMTMYEFSKSFTGDLTAIILKKGAPRLGAHIKALCLKRLEKSGALTTSSGPDPSEDVIRVLEKSELGAKKPFPIREFYEKLEAYYQSRGPRG